MDRRAALATSVVMFMYLSYISIQYDKYTCIITDHSYEYISCPYLGSSNCFHGTINMQCPFGNKTIDFKTLYATNIEKMYPVGSEYVFNGSFANAFIVADFIVAFCIYGIGYFMVFGF